MSRIYQRPKVDDWMVVLDVGFDPEFITRDELIEIIRLAGVQIGVGWGRKLRYGKWEIAE